LRTIVCFVGILFGLRVPLWVNFVSNPHTYSNSI
jgi:hypothetical protein